MERSRQAGPALQTGHSRAARVLGGLLSGSAVVVLDFFIVLACLPSIEQVMQASAAELQLIVAAYAVVNGSFLVVGGRLGDVYGRRRVFTIGLVLFAFASVACAFATTTTMLIGFRALQGVGGALIQPQVLGLLAINSDPADRQRVFGLYAAALGTAGIVAQLIGGGLVTLLPLDAGWRACFLVGVPVCALAALLVRGAIEGAHSEGLKVDGVGAILLATTLGCISLFLTIGRDQGWPAWSWLTFGAALFTGAAFGKWIADGKGRALERLLPLGIVRRPEVWSALFMIFLFYAGVASLYFVLALELRLTTQLSALQAGVVFGWFGVCFVIASTSSGLKALVGARWARVGIVALALGHVLLAGSIVALQGDPRILGILVACAFDGLGLGLLMGPIVATTISKFRQNEISLGGGLAATMQQIGNSLGVVGIGFAYFGSAGLTDRHVIDAVAYLLVLLAVLGVMFHFVAGSARAEATVDRPG